MVGVPAVANTLNELSYGGAMGTGSGMTWKPKADTMDALLAVAPLGKPAAAGARLTGDGVVRAGMAAERALAPMVTNTLNRGGLGADLLQGLAQGTRSNVLRDTDFGKLGFDKRYDKRVQEQAKLNSLTTRVDVPDSVVSPETIDLRAYAGHPFIATMSDRTGSGLLTHVRGTALDNPVNLQAGKTFMLANPGAWASATKPVKDIMELAHYGKMYTGKDPLIFPWTMAPTGSDYASMTGNTMFSYANSNMGRSGRQAVDKFVKEKIPDWLGIANPESQLQFSQASAKTRKSLQMGMDKLFRSDGGLGIGEARLAISDPTLLNAADGSVTHVGKVRTGGEVVDSNHLDYPDMVPGQGLGLVSGNRNIYEYLAGQGHNRNVINPSRPVQADIRALQMKPYSGLLDDELLKRLGY